MPRFIALVDFTRQGINAIEKTVDRAAAFRRSAEELGAQVHDVYWTLGRYDGVLIFDAPDGPTATALMLNLARAGNVRTETLRAFGSDQMSEVLGKVK